MSVDSPRLRHVALAALIFALAGAAEATERDTLDIAWKHMRMGRWNEAEQVLEPLTRATDAEIASHARFCLANLWQHRRPNQDRVKAQSIFQSVVDDFPDSEVKPWAMLALARLADLDVLKPDPGAAIELYQRVMNAHPGHDASHEAALHRAQAQMTLAGLAAEERRNRAAKAPPPEREKASQEARELLISAAQTARAELAQWRKSHPAPRYAAATASVLASISRYPLADYSTAVGYLREALAARPATTGARRGMTWQIAVLAERELNDRETAVEFYTKYLQEFPTDANAFRCIEALQRLGAPVPPLEDMSIEAVTRRALR